MGKPRPALLELDKFLIATEGLKLQPFYNPLMSLCNLGETQDFTAGH
jgi:hypothetical protein